MYDDTQIESTLVKYRLLPSEKEISENTSPLSVHILNSFKRQETTKRKDIVRSTSFIIEKFKTYNPKFFEEPQNHFKFISIIFVLYKFLKFIF